MTLIELLRRLIPRTKYDRPSEYEAMIRRMADNLVERF